MAPPTKTHSVSSEESFTKVDQSTTIEKKQPFVAPDNTKILEYTPLDQIPIGVQKLKDAFHTTQKTHSVQYRLNQLRNVYFKIKDNIDEICETLELDFYRSASETKNLEIVIGLNELVHTMSSLHKWVKPEPVTDLPVSLQTNPIYIEKIPLGVVLIISPFNYPFLLSLSAIIGALAAGNVVVFKPSELTPNFAKLFTRLLSESLDEDIFFTINGGIDETTKALEQKYDKIMYTGNNFVGRIIAKKAAETLTPVILELGGKSPAFVLNDVKDSDIPVIARRIIWGRFTNGGQTCVAVDYVLVHESIHKKLVEEIKRIIDEEFYAEFKTLDNSDDSSTITPSYTHVIHDRAFKNLSNIITTTKGDIITGGEVNSTTRFISPTVIDNVSWDDSSMKGEIFGPILPIIKYSNLSTALDDLISSGHDTPLAQYIFTSGKTSRNSNPQVNQVVTKIRSGATMINDVVLHVGLVNAPFGGVGNSGYGSYHGIYSFRAFTHERTTFEQKLWNDTALKARYPPYNDKKNKLIETSQTSYAGNVWFGRTGDVRINGPNSIFSVWYGFVGVTKLVNDLINAL
ncbi:putative fatty aldehyde dehydrogenase [Scheffersomyces coipomensis]|uniref:putative fatty aldehyde dehydrogenase n=1 Tax=Scheffersomyces coipomensis TaxID=1788519 RepID=UPI00315D375F